MNKGQLRGLAVVAVCAFVMGGAAVMLIGRGGGTGQGLPSPSLPIIQPADPAKEFIIRFYRAHSLNQDPAAAWEMMSPEMQDQASRLGKEHYLAGQRHLKVSAEPAGGIQTEKRSEKDNYLEYFVRVAGDSPMLIVIERTDDGYKVVDFGYWKGEPLP